MTSLKKPLIWALVFFCVYALIKSPDQAAAMVKQATGGIADGLAAVGKFFDALLARE